MSTRSLWALGSHTRGLALGLGRHGTLSEGHGDMAARALIADGLAQRVEGSLLTLTDDGAHVVYHHADTERGLDTSTYGGWRTKGEARTAGDLDPAHETRVLVYRGGETVAWQHPADCTVGR